MINKVTLIGNLGADPDVKISVSGVAVCNLRIATNETRKNAAGDRIEHTEWHQVVAFGKTAENAAKYLQSGARIYIEGKLRTSKWQDQAGVTHWTTKVNADFIRYL